MNEPARTRVDAFGVLRAPLDTGLLRLERETRSSIDFKLSAKNEPHWEVKVFFEDGYEEEAVERTKMIDAKLRAWQEAKP